MYFLLRLFYLKTSDRIQHGDDHDADICENRRPHVCNTDCSENQTHRLDRKSEHNIFVDNTQTFPGNTDRKRELHRVVIHQDNIRSLDCRIGTERTHGNTDVRSGEHRRIIDAVTDECQILLG